MKISYQSVQMLLFAGLILTCLSMIVTTFLDHSFRNFPYNFTAFTCVIGLHNVFKGLEQMQNKIKELQSIVWSKQPSILFGIVLLLGALMYFIQFGVAAKFPHKVADVVVIVTWIVVGVPCLLFLVRWVIYTIKTRLKISSES